MAKGKTAKMKKVKAAKKVEPEVEEKDLEAAEIPVSKLKKPLVEIDEATEILGADDKIADVLPIAVEEDAESASEAAGLDEEESDPFEDAWEE